MSFSPESVSSLQSSLPRRAGAPFAPLPRHEADFALPPGGGRFIVMVLTTFVVGNILTTIGLTGVSQMYEGIIENHPVKAGVAFGLVGIVIAALLKIKLFK